jgi:ribose transport system permease protein
VRAPTRPSLAVGRLRNRPDGPTADSPSQSANRPAGLRGALYRLGPYGSVVVLIAAIVIFSALRPETFATLGNARGILGEQAVLAFVALGVTIPLIAGQFDLSVAGNAGLTALLSAGLMSYSGLPWGAAVAVALACGCAIGLFNGLLSAYIGIHSFVATLGVGTILFGIQLWYGSGQIIFEGISPGFVELARTRVGSLTLPVYYMVGLAVVLWFVLMHTPFGRYLYAIGNNRSAAEVAGVRVKRYTLYSFVICGFLAACAGVMLASRTASAQAGLGDAFLLPAFSAAFIGAATFRRSEFNVPGTLVGVFLVAVLVAGAFQLGLREYVSPIINGAALILAVVGVRLLSTDR